MRYGVVAGSSVSKHVLRETCHSTQGIDRSTTSSSSPSVVVVFVVVVVVVVVVLTQREGRGGKGGRSLDVRNFPSRSPPQAGFHYCFLSKIHIQ